MPDATNHVHVALGERSYDIEIGSGNLPEGGRCVRSLGKLTHAIVVTDTNVRQPHAETCRASLEATGARVDVTVVPAGEASKSVASADRIWRDLCRFGADRKSIVVAVGGGVIGDLAGFVAAT